ncbi:PIN domain-containing protein [Candidatus Parabeggiatoa sp. HSG14]|uniref:type II toxin-antitoxin system VapC family toxin n=1 Tax=Candidatus Parabeggiatoa sp. HSG14 TaxID=3055593 RepID=UPI0025A88857|nr:PIN domain-containing protein [Thiotrichales bacterium HSG14]
MEWIEALQGQLIALDTAPLIYFIEEHPTYLPIIDPFFENLNKGSIRVVTSVITLSEVLVKPLRDGDTQLAQQYRDILLNVEGLTTVEVSVNLAEKAAQLRSQYSLRTPDAIQIATALQSGATALLTNDVRWPVLPNLSILVLDKLIAPNP